MPKEYINPNSLFPSLPHGFSQVVIATGKKMVFVSGQTAWDAKKNIVGGDSVLEQARQAFRNLEKENPPASTWIGVSALADPEFLIEIEATAVLD